MTQEYKDLLFKYLCAALPYHVFVHSRAGNDYELREVNVYTGSFGGTCAIPIPYLYPMSSMTEKDCLSLSKELNLSVRARGGDIYFPHNEDNTLENWNKVNNWLLKNHFDFMGLIPLNLAILVTEQNNPYKN